MNKLVSIIIPLYNHENYIATCLDSVFKQPYDNLELIIINDGSLDRSYEVALEWVGQNKDRFARVILESQENLGITKTVDLLIKKSSGDYVALLASDDFLTTDSIGMRVKYLEKRKLSAVFGDAIPINDNNEKIYSSAIVDLGGGSINALLNNKFIKFELIFNWCAYGSVLMFTRDSVLKDNEESILNKDIFSEDMQLYYYFLSKEMLGFINTPVCYYRIHGKNVSRSKESNLKIHKNLYKSRIFSARNFEFPTSTLLKIQAYGYYYRYKDKSMVQYIVLPIFYALLIIYLLLKKAYTLISRSL